MKLFFINIILFSAIIVASQPNGEYRKNVRANYDQAFFELDSMFRGLKEPDFKRAVFITENAYFNDSLSYTRFCEFIDGYVQLCNGLISSRDLNYPFDDKEEMAVYAAVFTVMTDTIPMAMGDSNIFFIEPFSYDFEDYGGHNDWSKMFVSKLLLSHKGNCHSLPYLYKILVQELGKEAYLSYAPNHIYIKQHCEQYGWYNTELTSGLFPIDAWIMASGYIHLDAVQNGIFMDTLGTKQSIGACIVDLAQGYEKRLGFEDGTFVIKACDSVLTQFPNNINALLLKAETAFKLASADKNLTPPEYQKAINKLNPLYKRIHELGYRKMPEEMYLKWLMSLKEEKEKYVNKKIINLNFE